MSPSAFDVQVRLAADFSSAALAREFTRRTLAGQGYEGRDYEILLIVSELVANALMHGTGGPVLRLAGTSDRLRVEVRDDSPVSPTLRTPETGVGGWGLNIVDKLAVEWGVARAGGGKVVWCDLTPASTFSAAVVAAPVP